MKLFRLLYSLFSFIDYINKVDKERIVYFTNGKKLYISQNMSETIVQKLKEGTGMFHSFYGEDGKNCVIINLHDISYIN